MQNLNNDIKSKEFQQIYLLYGEESFLKRSYKNQLQLAMVGDDQMNFNYYEGKGQNLTEIIDIADTLPFFADRRLIIMENSGYFKSTAEELLKYLPELPETTHIIFIESEVDKRSKLFKLVKSKGYAAELTRQTEAQLMKWILNILTKEGKKISRNSMELFLSKTGDSMENIKMELEKLICYTLEHEAITSEDIEAVCTEQITNKIFDMIGFVAIGNKKAALNLYQDLLTLREPPMRILFLLARQFNQLLQTKELMSKGQDKNTIASHLKIPPFVAGKYMGQCRSFERRVLKEYVESCVNYEEGIKTGKISDRLAVELLITKG